MITDADNALFADSKTTLDDIKAAGWRPYQSSGGGWWFDRTIAHHATDRFYVPVWIHELEQMAERRGVSKTLGQIFHALGLTGEGKGKTVKFRAADDNS